MNDPQPSPINFEPPSDTFFIPDDGYDASLESDPFSPLDDIDIPNNPPQPPTADLSDVNMDAWSWYETRLIGVEREDQTHAYEIGAIDLYANPANGDLGGSYLPIASFADSESAINYYHELQATIHAQAIPIYEMGEFAEQQAFTMNPEPRNWESASPDEYASYDYMRDLGLFDADDPPDIAIDSLIQTAIELGGVLEVELENDRAFQALQRIGIDTGNFNPTDNPPPYLDEQTGTAYWIGIFQPDKDDPSNCVTSILSLGQNPETGQTEAQLAPCVPGDWDKAYSAAEYLIQIAERGDIEQVFDTAEGMALATDQRNLWEVERGLPLSSESVSDIADLTDINSEVDL